MAKVLLVYVNSFMDNLIPLGVSILSACLKQGGHRTVLFDTTFYKTKEKTGDDSRVETLQIKKTNLGEFGIIEEKGDIISDFRKKIDSFKPDLIAFSAVEPTYEISLNLLNSIKDIEIPKIVGGIHATMACDEIIKEDSVDMVCVGEGEGAIVELADRIEQKKGYTDIQNLIIKKDGRVIKNPLRKLVDLDTLPDQDWSIYDKKRFYKPMGGKIWISGPIELNRGCPYHCAFCCNDRLQEIYKQHGKYTRERKVENFIRELKNKIKEYDLQYLYLVAENFLQMSDARFNEFVTLYKDIHLPFWIETRPETVNLDRISKLKEVGCEGISIGVEHGNDSFRREVLNRYVTNEKIIKAFDIAKKSNIRVCANNIIGFPKETRELIFDTIELNRELKADNLITNIFSPYRGTKLWQMCVDLKYIADKAFAGDYRSDAGLNMDQLSKEEIKGLQRAFPLYVKLPKQLWPEIAIAEKTDKEGNLKFEELSVLYKEKYM